jgi:lytic murein transglycosylase
LLRVTAIGVCALLGSGVHHLAAQTDLTSCLATLRATRSGQRVAPATWALLDSTASDPEVLAQLDAQPEFRLPVWDYLAVMADDERVRDGQAALAREQRTFDTLEARYGVDKFAIAAVWGVESNFGRGVGAYSVLRSLATLACRGRRQPYFRGELYSALRIVQAGHIRASEFRGSWAGAFGQTQFMPGVFEGRAVDFDGDGRRDLIGNSSDALASAANYLRAAGWVRGLAWGREVRVPASIDPRAVSWRQRTRTVSAWAAAGVARMDGAPLGDAAMPGEVRAALFAPAGRSGPVFLVTRNLEAIWRYNAAESYTIAIAHLADRLRGGGALRTPWPTDDPGLSREDRRALKRALLARGHAIGEPDALLTPATRDAVRREQARLGMPVTGRPGQRLLQALCDSSR